MKDTREAWEREGQGGRIDRRSLAERRDEAERAGDLEQEGQGLRSKRGFVRADRVGPQDLSGAGDLERDGLIERIKERIAGIYREASGAPGDMETTLAARDQWIELAKPTGDNRATRTRAATAIGPSLPDSASSGTLYGQ